MWKMPTRGLRVTRKLICLTGVVKKINPPNPGYVSGQTHIQNIMVHQLDLTQGIHLVPYLNPHWKGQWNLESTDRGRHLKKYSLQ